MTDKLILDQERDRRFMTWITAIGVALIYFYEYPMYWLLRAAVKLSPRYAEANQYPSTWTPPTMSTTDLGIVALILVAIALVYIRPRHYLQKNGDGSAYGLHRNGRHERDVSAGELAELGIYRDYRKDRTFDRASKNWRESQRPHLVVRVTKDPDIVLYDQREFLFHRHRGIVEQMESFFGNIRWKDKEGVISGRMPAGAVAEDQRTEARQKQVDDYLSKRSRRRPKVRTAWGARVFFALVFAGFGPAFWLVGGYRLFGWVFLGISLIILVDIVLTLMGYGQQPTRQPKSGKK